MVFGDVESLEIAPARLDFWALGDLVTHADENVLEGLAHLGHEVQVPCQAPGQHLGEVEAVGREPFRSGEGGQLCPPGLG